MCISSLILFKLGYLITIKLFSTVAKSGNSKEGRGKKITEAIDLLTLKPYSKFEKAFLTVLNKQAPLKTMFLRHNNNPFMTKERQKAIMKRLQLKNRYNKNRN